MPSMACDEDGELKTVLNSLHSYLVSSRNGLDEEGLARDYRYVIAFQSVFNVRAIALQGNREIL